PAENYGEFLSVGVQRALEAGVEAVHLEEPEFWARAGYSEGFKREWQSYYHEPWQPPQESVDGQWRASKLKYFLYRRALQQVFRHVQEYNQKTGRQVKCYVPTHSLINYAHWCIVSPQSSLATIDGCDGYIAQVWTGTSRTPNHFQGVRKERTFETAFLEYGAMQNLVRSTGRKVWYLNDPVEDNPRHDWTDYRSNWESTLTASLLQPDVWRYEVSPWPERVFGGKYPRDARPEDRKAIPPEYATELQVVMNALGDLKQSSVRWDAGTRGIGVLISDTMMFQREQPTPSDPNMAQLYGQLLPLLKRGLPVTPVQLENVGLRNFLADQRVLLLTYQGQKPPTAEIHTALAAWVNQGGVLVMLDDDSDPYNHVREWWNDDGKTPRIPRQDLFDRLGVKDSGFQPDGTSVVKVGRGAVLWLRENPVRFALTKAGDGRLVAALKVAAQRAGLDWQERNYLALKRGPYWIGAGLDETELSTTKSISGRFVNLFDPELKVQREVPLKPGARVFLLDIDAVRSPMPRLLASAGKALFARQKATTYSWTVEGVGNTQAILLFSAKRAPRSVTLEGQPLTTAEFEEKEGLLRVRFANEAFPRTLSLEF
ncbi:MAG TPA: hypothetical protein VMB21_01830, partial [Candidatus Limnocylindria bacterium]|nr:hypothetical protein [Candidatus Limnocylindria bacterium]